MGFESGPQPKKIVTGSNEGKSEKPIDLMRALVKDKLGTTGREIQLKIRIKEAEDTIADNPDHGHIEGWKQRLENDKKAMAQNESVLNERINKLPAEEATQFLEEYERTTRTIMGHREAEEK